MSVDRYTKTVLTVIAICLVWICVNGITPAVSAQQTMTFRNGTGPAVPVVVVGTGTLRRDGAVTVSYRGEQTDPTLPVTLPYTTANPLPARLPYTADAPLAVEVAGVRKGVTWEPIRVSVEDAPTRSKPGIGRDRH